MQKMANEGRKMIVREAVHGAIKRGVLFENRNENPTPTYALDQDYVNKNPEFFLDAIKDQTLRLAAKAIGEAVTNHYSWNNQGLREALRIIKRLDQPLPK